MRPLLPHPIWPALLLLAATACHRAGDTQPATLTGGAWRLAVLSGGFSGAVTTLPAGQQPVFQFKPDSTFNQYLNGQLQNAGTYQVRYLPQQPGLPQPSLYLTLRPAATGQPLYQSGYITSLSATELRTTTGGGCALNCQYVRVAGAAVAGQ